MRLRPLTFVLLPLLALAPATARADCEARAEKMKSLVPMLPDSRKKLLIQFDLQRANMELGEFDETECLEAIDHATHLLMQMFQVPE